VFMRMVVAVLDAMGMHIVMILMMHCFLSFVDPSS